MVSVQPHGIGICKCLMLTLKASRAALSVLPLQLCKGNGVLGVYAHSNCHNVSTYYDLSSATLTGNYCSDTFISKYL